LRMHCETARGAGAGGAFFDQKTFLEWERKVQAIATAGAYKHAAFKLSDASIACVLNDAAFLAKHWLAATEKSYVIDDIELVVIAARLLASPICFKCSVFPFSKKDLEDIIGDNICDKLEALFSNADCAADADKIGTTTAAAINDIVVPLLKAGADMSGIKNDAANRFGRKFAEFATKFKQEELKPWWEAASSTLPDINAHIPDIATKGWASCAFSMSLKSVADAQPTAKVSTRLASISRLPLSRSSTMN
jgi:hypothetical protein